MTRLLFFALGFLLGRLLAPRLLVWLLNAGGSLAGSPLPSPAVRCDGGEYWIDELEARLMR
jgi:hypothetical protein